jgi:2-hydroxycyclohexanecarboxyl-CoA dehydrogenase
MRGLQDKVAIVTGGGGGIGGATCRRFAEAGTTVVVLDVDGTAAERVAREIGGNVLSVACDITDHAAVTQAVAAVEARFGRIDILVNNAGWDVFRLFKDTSPTDWQKLISINLVGALNMHHAVLPGMIARGGGRIVNIASDAARVGSSGEAVYAACKAGLIGFSKTLAREHARHRISINVVCPGATHTALFEEYKKGAGNPDKLEEAFRRAIPMGRIGEPEDLPGAILFFSSDDAAFITGQVISVSGGLTMAG